MNTGMCQRNNTVGGAAFALVLFILLVIILFVILSYSAIPSRTKKIINPITAMIQNLINDNIPYPFLRCVTQKFFQFPVLDQIIFIQSETVARNDLQIPV